MNSGEGVNVARWGPVGRRVRRALLLPGITSSSQTMWELGDGLAVAGWSAEAVDWPGHGRSGLADSYRLADVARDVGTQVGAGWDLVLGHSLGGAIATILMASDEQFAGRALLLDPALRASKAALEGLVAEFEQDLVEQTAARVAADHPHWHPRTVTERVTSTKTTRLSAVQQFATQNRPWDVTVDARATSKPVHVLRPAQEPVLEDDLVELLREETSPQWTFETVADATHSVHRDRPKLVLDRILRW